MEYLSTAAAGKVSQALLLIIPPVVTGTKSHLMKSKWQRLVQITVRKLGLAAETHSQL